MGRLCLVTRRWGGGGGVERLLNALTAALEEWDVTLVHSDGNGVGGEGLDVIRVPRVRVPVLSMASFRSRGLRALEGRDLDIVHSHSLPGPGLLGASIASRSSIPHIITLHGEEVNLLAGRRGYRAIMEKLVKDASLITAVSPQLAVRARELFGVNVRVIPNGIDTELFSPAAGTRERTVDAAFVGMFRKEKGVLKALDVFAEMRERTPVKLSFLMVGDGPLMKKAVERAGELGLSETCRFTGLLEGEALAAVYRSTKCILMPSSREGQGLVALESLASSTPVVAWPVGGLKGVVREESGGLPVREGDIGGMAEAALTLIGDRERGERLGMAGRAMVVEGHGIEGMVAGYEKAYRELLGE